jgi:hypothetical protein
VGFAFERAKTVHTLDRWATVIDIHAKLIIRKYFKSPSSNCSINWHNLQSRWIRAVTWINLGCFPHRMPWEIVIPTMQGTHTILPVSMIQLLKRPHKIQMLYDALNLWWDLSIVCRKSACLNGHHFTPQMSKFQILRYVDISQLCLEQSRKNSWSVDC